jgi:hypothetical protein
LTLALARGQAAGVQPETQYAPSKDYYDIRTVQELLGHRDVRGRR